jgi:hypothetical protein
MFLIHIDAFEDFNTISKYTPANPDVRQPIEKVNKEGLELKGI